MPIIVYDVNFSAICVGFPKPCKYKPNDKFKKPRGFDIHVNR